MGSQEGAKVSVSPFEAGRPTYPEVLGLKDAGAVFPGRPLYVRQGGCSLCATLTVENEDLSSYPFFLVIWLKHGLRPV